MNNVVPGAVPYPGIQANYGSGILYRFWALVWHYTVGSNSLGLIASNGLCAFLIAQDGTIYQTAPWDSINWTQCEWNVVAQGIEVESLDGGITEEQILSLRYLTIFLCNVASIPLDFYDGDRLEVGTEFHGVTNHRNLHQHACAEHYDGFGQEIWDRMFSPTPAPTPKKRGHKMYIGKDGETYWLVAPGIGCWGMSPASGQAAITNGIPVIENPGWWHALVGTPVTPVINAGDVNVQLGDMVLNGTLTPK